MGVNHLWEILEEVKMEVRLEDMRGVTLAVDLGPWICEFEKVKTTKTERAENKRLRVLRDLFYRVRRLLTAGITPVFVLDGKAPKLKGPSSRRQRFNNMFKQCCELLDTIGVPWIKAEYEAEALCAELNKRNLVQGVLTIDSDAFLYGARTVYRNFKVKDEAVKKYIMLDVEKKLRLKQGDLIALALLLGCDYCNGVKGVGVKKAMELFSSFGDCDALTVFSMWKDGRTLNTYEEVKKTIHCGTCKHIGTVRQHRDSGCATCGLDCAESASSSKSVLCECEWCICGKNNKLFALEEKTKMAALKDPNFPNQDIIDEFLKTQKCLDPLTQSYMEPMNDSLKEHFRIKSIPNQDSVCKYFVNKLEWTTEYSHSQVSLVLTLLQKVKKYHKDAEDAKQRNEMEGEEKAQAGSNAGKLYEKADEYAENSSVSDDILENEFEKLSLSKSGNPGKKKSSQD